MFKFLKKQNYFVHHHTLEHKGDFLFLHEKTSAKKTFVRENVESLLLLFFIFAAIGVLVVLLFGYAAFWIMVFAAANLFYFSALIFKAFLMTVSIFKKIPSPSKKEIAKMRDDELPPYTILVPLYKEGRVLAGFVEHFKKINYPKEKMDVRFLLEEDDKETIEAAKKLNLKKPFLVVIIPPFGPRTKPKALNVGFIDSESEILTIYDAEDKPEPDQLRKVAWAFKNFPENVVCVQAKLTFYNINQNMLTRWFYVEYYSWFNYFLPALSYFSLPVPLGGTSNHFKTSVLKRVGGWDPYNVTEDADLGMRISRLGYKISFIDTVSYQRPIPQTRRSSPITVIESETREEATSALFNWLYQRTRWVKGYIQTSLVHLRHPLKTYEDLSLFGFFAFLFFVAGTPMTNLMNLVFWAISVLWLCGVNILPENIPSFLLTLSFISLVFGNLFFILIHALPMFLKKKWKIAFISLFIPIYWFLMSLATVRAVFQLFFNPHYWDKTEHGFVKEEQN